MVCGTVSVTSLGLAFICGTKHPYLLYTGIITGFILRNQGPLTGSETKIVGKVEGRDGLGSDKVRNELERLGAASLVNCVISALAFGTATVGVFGDMY
jgi:hypothetical protein